MEVTEIRCRCLNSVGGLTLVIGVHIIVVHISKQLDRYHKFSMMLTICVTIGAKTPAHLQNNQYGSLSTPAEDFLMLGNEFQTSYSLNKASLKLSDCGRELTSCSILLES
jgi:hypothetical protein